MRSLTGTLEAAGKSASAAPYVQALFDDYWGDRPRLRFARYYTGSETENYVACCVAGDGSLVRARVDAGNVYVSRVVSPGSGSTYSSWTSLVACAAAGVALAVSGATVRLFYVHTDGTTLREKVSADNGATWGAAADVTAVGGAKTYVAASYGGSDTVVFWSEGATVYRSRRTAGAWGARTAWTLTAASVSGLAVEYQGDYSLIVCGTAPTSTDAKVWACVFGDGLDVSANTWSALVELTTAVSGSTVVFQAPAVDYLGCFRAFFVEVYSSGAGGYVREHWSTLDSSLNFLQDQWAEPIAFAYQGTGFGMAAASSASGMWLVAAAGVWYGAYPAAAYDASGDVVEAEVVETAQGATVRLVLDNSSGRYGLLGAHPSEIDLNHRLALSWGYRTTAGIEVSTGPGYWVTAVSREWSAKGRSLVVVEARDAWRLLDRWRARRTLQWAAGAKTVNQLLTYLFARAGLILGTDSASSAIGSLAPAFTVHPGESGATAVRRLLAKVPDRVRMRSGRGAAIDPEASDGVDYDDYGVAHALLSWSFVDAPSGVNRARVVGAGVFQEAFDFDEIENAGELVANVDDQGIASNADATARAGFELRAALLEAGGSEVSARVNAGQELYDVVAVTAAPAGLSAELMRVQGLRWRFGASRYELALVLGAV